MPDGAWPALAIGGAMLAWGAPSRGWAALDTVPFGLALGYLATLAGRRVVAALRLPPERFGDLPTTWAIGFLAIELALLAAALALPLPIWADGLIVAAGVLAWSASAARGAPPAPPPSRPGLACLALSLAAATLWSVDAIRPTAPGRGVVVFRPWADGYAHAAFVRMFRDVRGVGTLEHFAMAGMPAPAYHYASFPIPGLLAATTGWTCYGAYSAFMVPMGMALSGLSAYALARWRWGPGAGLAATAGVLLVPDPSRYGVANPFLGYSWNVEIAPTWLYGIALGAVAWLLVLEGCRSRRAGLVGAGFVAAGLTVGFKAQLFVAMAGPIWVYPAFGFRGASARARLAWLGFAAATFAAAVGASGRLPGVPLIRLDGSGMKPYLEQLAFNLGDGRWGRALAVGASTTRGHDLAVGVVHLTLGTFGGFALLVPALAVAGRRAGAGFAVAAFPAVLMAAYLIMALGLAPDDRTHHMPEELLHRPLVWAYFGVAAWTTGGLYALATAGRRPVGARWAAAVLGGLLVVPLALGPGVQVGPGWGRGLAMMPVPAGLVRSAEYLRDRAGRDEVVQGSEDDRWAILAALAERRVYVADAWRGRGQADGRIVARLAEMARFRGLADAGSIARFAAERGIGWYVLGPDAAVRWPGSILSRPAFASGGYRVYRLGPPG